MLIKNNVTNQQLATSETTGTITIDLQYLSVEQAKSLISMFDSPQEYAENFSAIKAITRGLDKLILETDPALKTPIRRMFHTVNEIQGTLMRDNMQEHQRIIDGSGLMPDAWHVFHSKKGGESC
jgi:hypothetical protein